jgi:two-component system OmpR family response regulator
LAKILVIEDDVETAAEVAACLAAGGFQPEQCFDGLEGLKAALAEPFDAITLDRMLPGCDGLDVLKGLRAAGSDVPVLMISALNEVDDRVTGLRAGGDDYLVKPFDIRELTARVEALLRRGGDTRQTRLQVGALEMDLVERTVHCDGKPVDLLPREFTLLEYFMRRPGQIVTRAMLLEDVWNFKFMAQTNVVDVQIGNLRRKLDPAGVRRFIVNIRAVGFKLNADA